MIKMNRPFIKGFLYNDGSFEECYDFGHEVKGYGVGYSHPRHLNEFHGFKIKCFKDMDKALDDLELIRVLDDEEAYKMNIGNNCTKEQLEIIQKIFNESDKPVKIKINSISRKFYKSFEDFTKALRTHQTEEESSTQEFKSHISILAQ